MAARTLAVSIYVTAILALMFNVCLQGATGATFVIQNQCSYTVWAAGIPVGGGQALGQGQSWSVDVPAGTTDGKFWGRTGCSFDASGKGNCCTGHCGGVLSCTLLEQPPRTLVEYTLNGGFDASAKGRCSTGDCGGMLSCTLSGQSPTTLVEYALNLGNNQDFYDISVIDGFNVPLSLTPSDGSCYAPTCQMDQCPDAYLSPSDNTKTHACASGANYNIIFCPLRT